MLTKSEMDQKVAAELGISTKKVATITEAFIDELCNALTDHGGFYLVGLGKLVTKLERGGGSAQREAPQDPLRVRLYFTKSRLLKRQIERRYGIIKE